MEEEDRPVDTHRVAAERLVATEERGHGGADDDGDLEPVPAGRCTPRRPDDDRGQDRDADGGGQRVVALPDDAEVPRVQDLDRDRDEAARRDEPQQHPLVASPVDDHGRDATRRYEDPPDEVGGEGCERLVGAEDAHHLFEPDPFTPDGGTEHVKRRGVRREADQAALHVEGVSREDPGDREDADHGDRSQRDLDETAALQEGDRPARVAHRESATPMIPNHNGEIGRDSASVARTT
jgi:hypothetical protein